MAYTQSLMRFSKSYATSLSFDNLTSSLDAATDGITAEVKTKLMAFVTDILNFLGTTWSKYSVYTQSYAGNYGPTLKHATKAPALGKTADLRQRLVQEKSKPGTYSLADVASHDRPGDCWMIVHEKVYDVSRFADDHPGGTVISTYFGRDGTDVFATFHPPFAWRLLNDYYVGNLAREEPLDELLKDYREMRARYVREGLFKSSKAWFLLQTHINAALFAGSIATLCYDKSYFAILQSASLMGLFVQQCGWLAHDFLHQQVFESRAANTFFGYLFGNCVLGFSVSWWQTKHNIHHTAPNECDEQYTPLDEDIDTLPIIAWSKEILATVESKRILRVLQYQHYLILPLLFMARYSWTFGSMLFTFNPDLSPTKGFVEKATVAFHYVWFSWVAFHLLPGYAKPLAWMVATELVAGLLLGFVFTLSHNGKEVYNESKDFVRAQVVTTRNTKRTWFNDWFTGGLDTQIEHHLFPTMPRHNYPKIAHQVEALCTKHGLEYDNVSVVGASLAVVKALKEIADAASLRLKSPPIKQ